MPSTMFQTKSVSAKYNPRKRIARDSASLRLSSRSSIIAGDLVYLEFIAAGDFQNLTWTSEGLVPEDDLMANPIRSPSFRLSVSVSAQQSTFVVGVLSVKWLDFASCSNHCWILIEKAGPADLRVPPHTAQVAKALNQSSSFALVLKALLPQVAIPSFFERVDAFLLDSSRFQVDISNIILLLVMALANDLPRFLGLTLVGWDVLSRLQLFLWVRQLP
ncbi:hypothetical protein FXO38_18038 [Capsicum annuum]|nr:hypothetical protein FXO37_34047 [Capsicum annuum]KAF3648740.1 hypothetical protein FXO38_18038 [Capsicum annuum]